MDAWSLMILLLGWSANLGFGSRDGNGPDPCLAEFHEEIDDARRHPLHMPASPELRLCDKSLIPGWYRFKINGSNAQMPTSCVSVNHCSTQAPIWLSLNKVSLPEPGQTDDHIACTTWELSGHFQPLCCAFSSPVRVRNCGNYFVYFLLPSQSCFMSYCAEEVDNIIKPMDKVTGIPEISVKTRENKLELVCSYGSATAQFRERWKSTSYHVSWFRLVPPLGEKVHVTTMQEAISLHVSISFDENFHLGEEVFCEVEAFHKELNYIRQPPVASMPVFLGIKIHPQFLTISENGSIHTIHFTSTVPYLCSEEVPPDECRLLLRFNAGTVSDDSSRTDVALSSCEVALHSGPCSINCGSSTINITAVQDFMNDGITQTNLEINLMGASGIWAAYRVPDIKVRTLDVPIGICYSFTEPHFITFDSRRYDFYGTGTFILIKSTSRKFQVHNRIWQCGSTPFVSCNCGVAAQEGNDLVILDICDGKLHETDPEISIMSLVGEQPGIKVLQSKKKKIYTLLFQSGAFIRAFVEKWGISLAVQIPSMDYEHTRGLCGIFDENTANDFHGSSGETLAVFDNENGINTFVNFWRLDPGRSLFDKIPRKMESSRKTYFCLCAQHQVINASSLTIPSTIRHNEIPITSHHEAYIRELFNCDDSEKNCEHCGAFKHVAQKSLLVSFDITEELILKESVVQPYLFEDLFFLNDQGYSESKNQRTREYPQSAIQNKLPARKRYQRTPRGDIPANLVNTPTMEEERSYIFSGDTIAKQHKHITLEWPTPGGLLEHDVTKWCHKVLSNSSIAQRCKEYIQKILAHAIAICITDVTLMDDKSWAIYSLPLLETQCEQEYLKKRESWQQDEFGIAIPPKGIVEVLNCPNACSGNGVCLKQDCICDSGYGGDDCSVLIDAIPQLLEIGNGGFCDTSLTSCETITISGINFKSTPLLSCNIAQAKYEEGKWEVFNSSINSLAVFINPNQVKCLIPAVNESSEFNTGPDVSWRIKVSNDQTKYSEGSYLTVYNSSCQTCTLPQSVICVSKPDVCIIEGKCIQLKTKNPKNGCEMCLPEHSQDHWVKIPWNTAPYFIVPQDSFTAFNGENFTYLFSAFDEEGDPVTFKLDEPIPGVSLKPNGYFEWMAESDTLGSYSTYETFKLIIADACNMVTKFILAIELVPCECVNGGTCLKPPGEESGSGNYICQCPPGFIGTYCENKEDHCASNPCVYGTCINLNTTFSCFCDAGYFGTYCENKEDYCASNPCVYGTCINLNTTFSCLCNAGYSGEYCEEKQDYCASSPCVHGTCVTTDTKFSCLCSSGYSGDYCEEKVNYCISSPCDHGICISTDTTFLCICDSGYSGPLCNEQLNPCDSNPCMNGSCVKADNLFQGFQCSCHPGYSGALCDEKLDPCFSSPCVHGFCLSTEDHFKCACQYGYSGILCEEMIDLCNPNPCIHGTCTPTGSTFNCVCKPGYSGPLCSDQLNPCDSNPCMNGTCVNADIGFQCSCLPGYSGTLCDEKLNPCLSSPCVHGFCSSTEDHFKCLCQYGYTGTLCDEKLDPCLSSPCVHGFCSSTEDHFKCLCQYGYSGTLCEEIIDLCNPNPCIQGTCTTVGNKLQCICKPGYSGAVCDEKLDPCSSSPCIHGFCLNTEGDFKCLCQFGYSGKLCDRENRCASNPCYPSVICTDLGGNFSCGPCPRGFTGNGINCLDINDCINNPCFPGVHCIDTVAPARGFTCGQCPANFTGDGIHCKALAPRYASCGSDSPCYPGVECKKSAKGFECGQCPLGYKGNGFTCKAVCKKGCQRNQNCVGPDTCRCKNGYTGKLCNIPICYPSCLNKGVCIKPGVCRCQRGFSGDYCQTAFCNTPCLNGGRCVWKNFCACPYGYAGKKCEIPMCHRNCQNGGTCISPEKCACPPDWTGPFCTNPLCNPFCHNGGTCLQPGICICPRGFYGKDCTSGVCFPPCLNGGKCIRFNTCSCPQGWTGSHCEKPICESGCLNGGKCRKPNKCSCLSGWKGNSCQKPVCVGKCWNGGTCVLPDFCACPPGYRGAHCQELICTKKCLHGGRCIRPGKCLCKPDYQGDNCAIKRLDYHRHRHWKHRRHNS